MLNFIDVRLPECMEAQIMKNNVHKKSIFFCIFTHKGVKVSLSIPTYTHHL